jgi:hypothetical protein
MKKFVNAHLFWADYKQGRRKKLIGINSKYCPIIVFKNTPRKDDEWSAEIYFEDEDNYSVLNITLSFLSDRAPFELLKTGSEFELFEGSKCVATGIII